MAVPRNNLNELLAKVSTTPSTTRATNLQAPGSNTGKSKFKPAASRASPSIPSSVAVHKTTSYTSFSTPGFGKTKPAPPLAPSNTHATPSSSSQSSAAATFDAQPSANAHSSASKRTSPASFSAVDPPSKRSRPSTEPDKENFVDSDTQIIDITQAEDSGYISFRDKGKGRDMSSATFSRSTAVTSNVSSIQRSATSTANQSNASTSTSYMSGAVSSTAMTVSKPSPLHISTSSTGGSSRMFSFDYGDLLTMSSNELEIHKTDLLDARGQIMDLRGQADKPMAAILRKFDEILQDRLQCLTSCQSDAQAGRTRLLPQTKWTASSSVEPTSTGQTPHRLELPAPAAGPSTASITQPSYNDDFMDDFPVIENLDAASDDELWEQTGEFDDTDFNSQILPSTSTHIQPASASQSHVHFEPIVDSRLASPIDEPDPNLTQAPSYEMIKRTLRDTFQLQSFRKNQLEAITAFMAGHDTFVLMPTGGGKSLCFQLPAVCKNQTNNSVTIVVGPLLALMQDQVTALERKGLNIVSFTKDSSAAENAELHKRLNHPEESPCMLYVTPEKLQHSNRLKDDLRKLHKSNRLGGIVIDEAHCITTWGRSFRDSYTQLDWLRKEFPGVPFMALTATANKQAVEDIIIRLGITNCKRFTMSFNRKNLYYEVHPKRNDPNTIAEIMTFITENYPNGTGIIYLNNRSKCDTYAEQFKKKGFSVASYHADMPRETKMRLQNEWQEGRTKIIIATIAFGMGIDKPDVRFVIHFGMPNSLSEYYQETGRAGRDGKPSHCRLYYTWRDAVWKMKVAREEAKDEVDSEDAVENILNVVRYCQNTVDCRRVQVLKYFDETFDSRHCLANCDNCRDTSEVTFEDLTIPAHKLLEFARSIERMRVTRPKLLEQFVQRDDNGLGHCNKGEKKERADRVFDHLFALGMIQLNMSHEMTWTVSHIEVTRKADAFTRRGDRVELRFRKRPTAAKRTKKGRAAAVQDEGAANEPGPSRAPAKRARAVRATEIEEDPIDLYISDQEEVVEVAPTRTTANRPAARPVEDVFTESDFVAKSKLDPETELMIECQKALRDKVIELQKTATDDVDALFSEDTLALLGTILPADIETFRSEMRMVDDFDLETANKYIPDLVTVCIKYRARLDSLKRKQPAAKPLSIDHYQYRQPSTSKPASGRR